MLKIFIYFSDILRCFATFQETLRSEIFCHACDVDISAMEQGKKKKDEKNRFLINWFSVPRNRRLSLHESIL